MKTKYAIFYFGLLIIFGLTGCQPKNEAPVKQYREPNRPNNLLYIMAEITNLKPMTPVALYKLHPRTEAAKLIAKQNATDNKISFPVTVNTPTFYLLVIGNEHQVPLLMHKSDVEVRANLLNFDVTLSTLGCRDTELLVKMQDIKRRLSQAAPSMTEEQYNEAREKTINTFIDQAMPSLICISAISSLPLDTYYKRYQKVIAELQKTHPDSEYLKHFAEGIALKYKNQVGTTLPDQSLALYGQDTIPLSSLRGKYVLLDFWQSNYPGIKQDNERLKAIYQKYKDDLEIVSVSMDGSPEEWQVAIQDLPWKHIYDVNPDDFFSPTAATYGYFSINVPTTFLLDREGVILDRGIRGSELGPRVYQLLEEKAD
ncbi:MAG: peroxiredoxin family protein [Bernardetiaceae bacterium]